MDKSEMTAYRDAAIERWRRADQVWRTSSACVNTPERTREVMQELAEARESIVFCRDAVEGLNDTR